MAEHPARPPQRAAAAPIAPDGGCAPVWRVLDISFGSADAFLRTRQAWENSAPPAGMLHYVALVREALRPDCLFTPQRARTVDPAHLAELATQWPALEPGFNRLTLAQGRVLLTICLGEAEPMLRELAFEADRIHLSESVPGGDPNNWSPWLGKALARLCRRGTELQGVMVAPHSKAALAACGFALQADAGTLSEFRTLGVYAPRWEIRHTRTPVAGRTPAAHCVVIGAGLAGASVAASLARRGWQVDVLDQAVAPAGGASGLPVGLLVPHVSADDCLLSRLSRTGVRFTLAEARALLQEGQDWAPSGVMGHALRGAKNADSSGAGEHWHEHAAWIKPAALVQAWLAQPGIRFQGAARAIALRRDSSQWVVADAQGQELARSDRVVLANGLGALPLLRQLPQFADEGSKPVIPLPRLSGVHGLVSWGFEDEVPGAPFPVWPVNGSGSLVAGVPLGNRNAWFAGAGYHPCEKPLPTPEECHRNNHKRLGELLPELAGALTPAFEGQKVRAWEQIRCATPDRLPLLGPLDDMRSPGLWLFTGLGSRGLTFSALGAELMAARWAGEPLPLPLSQVRKLDAARPGRASK